jgi:hypothetical protein
LGNFGQFWAILGNFGQFWAILGNFGLFWAILGYFGLFWAILGYFGLFLGYFWNIMFTIAQNYGIIMYVIFITLPKDINTSIGETSPNLVALIPVASSFRKVDLPQ